MPNKKLTALEVSDQDYLVKSDKAYIRLSGAPWVPRWRWCATDDGSGDDVDVVMMLMDGGDDVGGWCTGSSRSVGMRCGGEDVRGGCDEMKVSLYILKDSSEVLSVRESHNSRDSILLKVILNGDGPIQVTTDEKGIETEVHLKTAQALLQRQRERKAKSILLLAIPDEYQLMYGLYTKPNFTLDAKSLWTAIKSRFGGNVESKKMQKNVLKQQFENF
ncbi:hypothetical protein Tco_0787497, partial [Tanacetum coccineum]